MKKAQEKAAKAAKKKGVQLQGAQNEVTAPAPAAPATTTQPAAAK
jgi:hypothetical protein